MPNSILSQITAMGQLNYPLGKIINILDIENIEEFKVQFYNPQSEVYKAYQKGKDKADFAIDKELYELAKQGDIDALDKLELRRVRYQEEQERREALREN